MTKARNIKSIADAQYYAERRLPRLLRDYYRAGTGAKTASTVLPPSSLSLLPFQNRSFPLRSLALG